MISIVIPTKDRPETLRRTLYTIVNQTIAVEIVVCDDRSTAENSTKNRQMCEKSNVVYLLNPGPFGVANARNYAAAHCSGEFIAFCDDDDYWMPEKSSNQLNILMAEQGKWAYSAVVIANAQLEPLALNYGAMNEGKDIHTHNLVPGGCSSVIVQKSLFEFVGGFDSTLSMYADWDLWIRLSKVASPVVSPAVDVVYILHDGQMSDNCQVARDELELVLEKHSIARELCEDSLLGIDQWVARRCIKSGQIRAGVDHINRCKNRVDLKVIQLVLTLVLGKIFYKLRRRRTLKHGIAVETTQRLKNILRGVC